MPPRSAGGSLVIAATLAGDRRLRAAWSCRGRSPRSRGSAAPRRSPILAVLAVLAAAWLAAQADLSPALGAFVVGVLLSGSPFHHQVAAEVTPFKGLLLGLFFISVGMSIDLSAAGGALGRDRQPGGGADPAQGPRDLRPVPPVRADQRRRPAHLAAAHPGRRVRLRPVRRRRRHGRDGHAAADHRAPGHLAVDGGDAVPGPARRPAGRATSPARRPSRPVRPRRGSGAT